MAAKPAWRLREFFTLRPSWRGGTPASAAAVRCRRIRDARGIEMLRVGIPAFFGTILLMYAGSVARMFLEGLRISGSAARSAAAVRGREGESSEVSAFVAFLALAAGFYWLFPVLARFVTDRQLRTLTVEWHQHWRSLRSRARRWLMGLTVVAALAGIGFGAFVGWRLAVFVVGGMLTFYTPAVIAVGLFASRRGRRLMCARCGYAMGSWRSAAERCPECGRAWREPWRHVVGDRCVSWPLVGAGGAGIVIGGLMLAGAAAAMQW